MLCIHVCVCVCVCVCVSNLTDCVHCICSLCVHVKLSPGGKYGSGSLSCVDGCSMTLTSVKVNGAIADGGGAALSCRNSSVVVANSVFSNTNTTGKQLHINNIIYFSICVLKVDNIHHCYLCCRCTKMTTACC
jgi:hypothetical protein